MNKTVVRTLLFLILAAFSTAACNWFDPIEDGKIPQGVIFYTGCPVVFYFVNEDGEDLVNIERPATYPAVFRVPAGEDDQDRARQTIQTIRRSQVDYYVYNEGSNWLWKDSDEQRIAFQTYLWGKTVNTDAKIYVYGSQNAAADSLQIKYKYTTAAENPDLEGTWGVDVLSIKYNEVEVFENNKTGKVFIVKPSQGETSVKVGSLD